MTESNEPILLKVYNSKVEIVTESELMLKAAKKQLKISYQNPRNKAEWLSIYLGRGNFFPSGYLEQFAKRLHKKKIQFAVEDLRSAATKHTRLNFNLEFEMKRHQNEALAAAEESDRGIISSPTASGKSAVIGGLIYQKQVVTLVVTVNTTIRDNLNESFQRWFGSSNSTTAIPVKPWAPGLKRSVPEMDMSDDTPAVDEFEARFAKRMKTPKESVYDKARRRDREAVKRKIESGSWFKPITVVCWNSLKSLPKEYLKSVGQIVIDECHASSIADIRNAIFDAENAPYCYGLSATPWRDQFHLFKLMQAAIGSEIIYEYPIDLAIEEDIVAKPNLNVILSALPARYLRGKKNPRTIIDDGIIRNRERNLQIVKKAIDLYDDGDRVLIAIDETSHFEGKMVEDKSKRNKKDPDAPKVMMREKDTSYSLKSLFEAKGVPVYYISGDLSSKERVAIIKELNASEGPFILVGSQAIGVGTDLPRLNKVFLAAGGKSSIRLMQWIGRGMRTNGEKGKTLEVFTFMDAWNEIAKRWSVERMRIFAKHYPGCKIF